MSTIARRLLREDIYEAVLTQIFNGTLSPGERVRDTALAEQFDVSRTPVREALVKLAQDGFLDEDANRGFRVRQLDPQEVEDVYPIVASLETLALELCPPLEPEFIALLHSLNEEIAGCVDDPIRRLHLDEEWHQTLLGRCTNKRLLSMIAGLKKRLRVYEYDYWRNARLAETSTAEHHEIVKALSESDIVTATILLRRQFSRTVERLTRSNQRSTNP